MPNPGHIVPAMVGDAAKCKWILDLLAVSTIWSGEAFALLALRSPRHAT